MASIIDADIDFEHGPLASNHLFLITGPTGAGKSTILNCMCICLYNTAPSIAAFNKKGQLDGNNVQLSSPVTLIRQGARDDKATKQAAWIEVGFIGADGVRYQARWCAHRVSTRKGKDGARRETVKYEVTRSLQCGPHCDKLPASRDALASVLGLNYDQFTRTVVLAQGKFSEFLSADDSAKAALLEEITGTEEFSRIGALVYKAAADKKHELEELQAELRGADLLSAETVANLTVDSNSLRDDIDKLSKSKAATDAALRWLDARDVFAASVQKAEAEATEARKDLESPEVRAAIAEAKAFDDTAPARAALQRLRANETELTANEADTSSTLRDRLPALLSALRWLRADTKTKQARRSEVDRLLSADQDHEAIYARAPEAQAIAKSISQHIAAADAAAKQERDQRKKEPDLKKQVQRATDTSTKAEATLAKAKEEAQRCAQAADKVDITAITARVKSLSGQLSLASQAEGLATSRADIDGSLATERKEAARLAMEIANAQSRLDASREALPELERTAQITAALYDAQKQISDHIEELRQKLAEEHRCPLCGTEHVHFHTDAVLAEHLEEARKAADAARAAEDEERKSITQAETALAELRRNATERGNKVKKLESDLADTDARLNKALADLGVESAEALPELKAKLTSQNQATEAEATNAQNAVNALTAANAAAAKAQEAATAAAHSLTEAKSKADGNANAISDAQAKETQARADADTALASLLDIVPTPIVESAIPDGSKPTVADATRLAGALTTAASNYAKLQTEAQNLKTQLEAQERQIATVSSAIEPLAANIDDLPPVPDEQDDELEDNAHALALDVASLRGRAQQLRDAIAAARGHIAECLKSQPGHTQEDVERLAAQSERIAADRKRTDEMRTRLATAEGALAHSRGVMKVHEASRPPMDDNPDVPALRAKATADAAALEDMIARKSGIDARLADNATRASALEQKRSALTELERECRLWAKLNDAIGGSGGARFRAVAQLYVLRLLLEKSNQYLRELSPRYTLTSTGRSLTISVTDSEQGGAVRPCSSLSGGESFIVSLSLALGLAAINARQISVRSLFIDEGFGTLSSDCLNLVLTALETLHGGGKRSVGIISHVEAIKDRIPAQIVVRSSGANISTVTIQG